MQAQQTLAGRLKRLGKHQSADPNHVKSWLDDLKTELAAGRQADAEAQYRRDALMTTMMMEMRRVHCVELLEEMNRELLDNEGRVEPIYTTRHELCFSWSANGGRHEIYVAADIKPDTTEDVLVLIVKGAQEQIIEIDEDALKKALVEAFRHPLLNKFK